MNLHLRQIPVCISWFKESNVSSEKLRKISVGTPAGGGRRMPRKHKSFPKIVSQLWIFVVCVTVGGDEK